jgi:hypothetical protein
LKAYVGIIFSGQMLQFIIVVVDVVQEAVWRLKNLKYLIGEESVSFSTAKTRCHDLHADLVMFENREHYEEFMSLNTL